jgi:hypothetical protein
VAVRRVSHQEFAAGPERGSHHRLDRPARDLVDLHRQIRNTQRLAGVGLDLRVRLGPGIINRVVQVDDPLLGGRAPPLQPHRGPSPPRRRAAARRSGGSGRPDPSPTARSWRTRAAVRSHRVRDAIASTATPRLKAGALQRPPRLSRGRAHGAVRPGGLIPNPLVLAGDGAPVRLDTVLRGRAAVLTAGHPSAALVDLCRRHRLLLVQVGAAPAADIPGHAGGPDHQADGGWVEVTATGDRGTAALRALMARPGVSVLVRPTGSLLTSPPRPACPACPGPSRPPRLPRPAG